MIDKDKYKTLLDYSEKEIEIKKSRFIGYAKQCETEEDALAFIEEINKLHRQATHNCYAYANGVRRNTQRYSDDGEPQGTAGIPILEVIKKEDLTNVAIVVTRYFGGVKLGASGLIRAYTAAAVEAIEAGTIIWKKNFYKMSLEIDYTLLGKIDNLIANEGFFELDRDYTDKVKIYFYIHLEKKDYFIETMTENTNGQGIIEVLDEVLLSERKGQIIGG